MAERKPCLTDHQYVEWSVATTTAGGKQYQTNKFRCAVCGSEVLINDTPSEIAARKRVVKDADAGD